MGRAGIVGQVIARLGDTGQAAAWGRAGWRPGRGGRPGGALLVGDEDGAGVPGTG
jgi:hypothetical protein